MKVQYLPNNTHLRKITFWFEGKFRKHDIFMEQKLKKTNKYMIVSALFRNFCLVKIIFPCSEKSFIE